MFTFSFGSAFATVSWTGEATSKTLNEAGDYALNGEVIVSGTTAQGAEGITEAHRAQLTATAKAELRHAKKAGTFYASEKAAAVAAIEAYIEAVKTVKTAKDAKKLTDDLADKVGTWNGTKLIEKVTNDKKLVSLPTQELVRALAVTEKGQDATANTVTVTATEDGIAKAQGTAAKGDAVINIVRKAYRAGDVNLYLPGYATLVKGTNFTVVTAAATTESKFTVNSKDTAGTIFVSGNDYDTLGTTVNDENTLQKAVIDWFMDNNYRTAADFTEGVRAFDAALVAVNASYTKTVEDAAAAIQTEIDKFEDKAALNTRKGLGISELEGIDALVKKINEYDKTYKNFGKDLRVAQFKKDIANGKDNPGLAANYFDQYYSEVSAVPEVKKLTDADKATVIALYKKVMALEDAYSDIWDYAGGDAETYAWDFNKLKNAYEHFLKADVKAFGALDGFAVATKGTEGKYYFDASEKNVNAVKAQRTAYDALVANYGYADLNKTLSGIVYDNAAKAEALILAAEHNQGADAAYDVKDTKKLQAYLNNATLKVTTKALGNSKIRVNARFDAETYKDIVAECGNDYTISYKFYQKSAKATSFKGPKEKSRNYITYTKASLKKGTKYKFQCGVVIKDAQGNVVAEKNYRASTTGSRVCR